jgi:predicted hotdog family 3-hydroxylacyl-ACP dehydratase
VVDTGRVSAAALLPHTQTARLLDEIVRHGDGFIEAVGRIPASHPLAHDGHAPCFLGLDMGAQAAAALEALERAAANGTATARMGQLVRARNASFARADLPTDAALVVTARLIGAAPPLAIYEICVSLASIESLRATISTYQTEASPVG